MMPCLGSKYSRGPLQNSAIGEDAVDLMSTPSEEIGPLPTATWSVDGSRVQLIQAVSPIHQSVISEI